MVSTPNSPIDLLTKFERILRLIDMEESIILGDVNCNILENNHIGIIVRMNLISSQTYINTNN